MCPGMVRKRVLKLGFARHRELIGAGPVGGGGGGSTALSAKLAFFLCMSFNLLLRHAAI